MAVYPNGWDETQGGLRATEEDQVTGRKLHVIEPSLPAGQALGRPAAPPSLLHPPAARPGSVLRRDTQDRLSESLAAKLVLVIAPAGWGKTSLLRDWWVASDSSGRAWLSVQAAHNDPARFWSDVIETIGTASPGFGTDLATVAWPAQTVVDPLISELSRMPGRVTLVLDDFHVITNPDVLECFASLVEHLPPSLGLVVAARSDPPMPLARLRVRGEMAEIRPDVLAFSDDEASQLLTGTLDLALSPEHVHALRDRTEGWAAGLYLAGLALRERHAADPGEFVRAFTGDDRHIADYLATEVLATLPPAISSFLLRTCVLGRLCGSLCDAVTGSSGSQGVLEEIERTQLFVVPLDNARHWYRYHPLFAEALLAELDRAEPGLAALLHRRASAWHHQHGSVTDAISHAIAAGDLPDAAELIAAHWDTVLEDGQIHVLRTWLGQLPPEMVANDARMCLIQGFAACYAGCPHDAEPWLAAAKAVPAKALLPHGPASVESGVALIEAACYHAAGNLAAAEAAARRAAELELETGAARWRADALAMLGTVLFWRGRHADAQALLEHVIGPAHAPAGSLTRLLALGSMSAIASAMDDLDTAGRLARQGADLAARHQLQGHWTTVTADLTTADLLVGQGQLADAETVARRALDHARRDQAHLETAAALLCLAAIHSRADRAGEASALISEAGNLIAQCPDPGILARHLASTEGLAAPPSPVPPQRRRSQRPDGLTDREAEVLQLLTQGCTNLEIAAKLVVSVHTVERHLQNAYRKISARNRADAAAYMARGSR
ncbi:MAG TPA: LuxR C-terminal-related transcriptional regulator [Trebonia sp.]